MVEHWLVLAFSVQVVVSGTVKQWRFIPTVVCHVKLVNSQVTMSIAMNVKLVKSLDRKLLFVLHVAWENTVSPVPVSVQIVPLANIISAQRVPHPRVIARPVIPASIPGRDLGGVRRAREKKKIALWPIQTLICLAVGADHPDPVCRVVLVVSTRKILIALGRIRERAQIVRLANTAMVATVDVQIVNMENIDLQVKTSVNCVRLESMHRPRLLM